MHKNTNLFKLTVKHKYCLKMTALQINQEYPKLINIYRKKFVELKAIKDFLQYSSSGITVIIRNFSKEEINSCIITKSNSKIISLHNAVVLLKRIIKTSAKYKTKQLAGKLLVHWRTVIDVDSVNFLIPKTNAKLNTSYQASNGNQKINTELKVQFTTEEYARLCDSLLEEINYPCEFRVWKKLNLLSQQFPDVLAFKEFKRMSGLVKQNDNIFRLLEIDQIADYFQQKFNLSISSVKIECVLIDIGFLKKHIQINCI